MKMGYLKINLGFLGDNYKNLKKTLKNQELDVFLNLMLMVLG